MIRTSQAVNDNLVLPSQIDALRKVLDLTMKTHQFERIVLVARVSPNSIAVEDDSMNTSIIRQTKFLKSLLPSEIPVELVEATHVSAFNDDFVDLLEERLESLGSNALLVSSSLDRVVRSQRQFSRLLHVLAEGDHAAASFLWDHNTLMDVELALRLRDFPYRSQEISAWQDNLRLQARAPMFSTTLPLVQPIIWAGLADSDTEELFSAHTQRHIRNAEEWVQAVTATSYQGEANIAPELSKADGDRGLTPARAKE